MIKFNDDSIYVGQIKQLLNDFNLPQIDVYKEGKSYSKGQLYIKGNSIYKIDSNTGKEVFVSLYKLNDYIPNLTKNIQIKNTLYDTYTHEYLGDYLRFIRDFTGINLMSMYNCFTYNVANNVKLDVKLNNKDNVKFYSDEEGYNIFMLPVKFGETYTVGIDCSSNISFVCAFYDNEIIHENDIKSFISKSFINTAGIRYNKPMLYNVPDIKNKTIDIKEQEKNLKLFIKIPESNKSSVTVLEGNYLKCTELFINNNLEHELGNKLLDYSYIKNEKRYYLGNYDYINKPQLLAYNFGIKYLLADRLVEYLSEQAITPNDKIYNNIYNLQNKLMSKKYMTTKVNPGIWDDSLRKSIYKIINEDNLNNKYYDVISYFDSTVESDIGGINKEEL